MADTANLHYGNLYESDKYVRMRYNKYLMLINMVARGEVNLLEIGCYTAKLAELLPDNIKYVGVDFDDKAIEIARKRNIKVSKLNLDQDGLGINTKFDIIVAAEVLEHLVEPARLMEQMKLLLAEGGHVLISLPNENTIYHRLMSLFGIGIDMCVFQPYKHLHFPTIQQSVDFVSKYFKIAERQYYINPGAKGSRAEGLGILLKIIPDFFWQGLANIFPGCFARGVILLCTK